jgi:hypothetical protein
MCAIFHDAAHIIVKTIRWLAKNEPTVTGSEWLWCDSSYYPSVLFTETEECHEKLLLSHYVAKHSVHLKITKICEKRRLATSKNNVPNKVLVPKRD